MTWAQVLPPTVSLPMHFQVAVPENAIDLTVNLPATITETYNVDPSPNWNTTVWTMSKSTTSFYLQFGTPAPTQASLDITVEVAT